MSAKLLSAFGYQGDEMNLPVENVDASVPFYVEKLGFEIVEQDSAPAEPPASGAIKRVVLERDGIRIALAENGGDPSQDGCAFHTDDVEALNAEFRARGLEKLAKPEDDTRKDGSRFKVFFVVAPDGLCFWFGQRQEQ